MMTGCIAHPCEDERVEGRPFCKVHAKEHDNSVWVKSFRRYQEDIAKYGLRKAVLIIKDM